MTMMMNIIAIISTITTAIMIMFIILITLAISIISISIITFISSSLTGRVYRLPSKIQRPARCQRFRKLLNPKPSTRNPKP